MYQTPPPSDTCNPGGRLNGGASEAGIGCRLLIIVLRYFILEKLLAEPLAHKSFPLYCWVEGQAHQNSIVLSY